MQVPKSRQDLTVRAGRLAAAVVESLKANGVDGTPMELTRDAWEASAAALKAGATATEIRKAGGLT